MTAKGFSILQIAFIVGVFVLAFCLYFLFPALPWYFYLALGAIEVAIFVPLYKRLERGLTEAVSDERSTLVAMKAAFFTFRVTFPATMLAGTVLLGFPGAGADWILAGRALVIVAGSQAVVMSISALAFDRRSR
jgi:hypothetical protein